MSNEAGNNMESKEQQSSDSKKCRGEEFGRAVWRIAVAQMCKSVGFQSFKESALEALADIAIKYLGHLGKISSFYANLAGRTECNVFDIIRGLEELESSSQGFQAAWEPNHCLATSGSVKNIVRYVNLAEEIPFARPLPRFPVMIANRKPIPSFAHIGETPPRKHVPNWLPAFPDARKSLREPCRVEKMELAKKSLLGLQQRLVSCGSARSGNGEIEFSGGESNSCLQEIEEDGIGLSSGNSIAMDGMSHLSPAIDAIKSGGLAHSEDVNAKILPIKRPLVQFKLKTSKTLLGASVKLNAQMAGMKESMFWLRRDDERDQKRDDDRDQKMRRIENIL